VSPVPWERTHDYAKRLAQRLEAEHPERVVHRMTKALRPGKVLIDWSQNNGGKTTVAPYSLRARPLHTVSTPVTWEEIEGCRAPEDLRFLAPEVLSRVEESGDLLAPLLTTRQRLPRA
jgi:bifunctional non-homologous end joining protein LigD